MNMSHVTLSNLETGKAKVDADWLYEVAGVLGVSPCDFYDCARPSPEMPYRAAFVEEMAAGLPAPERELVSGLLALAERYLETRREELPQQEPEDSKATEPEPGTPHQPCLPA